MNYYEELIKTYDRRIKRIEQDADPKYLRSTKLFYELERESCIARLQAWKDHKPFAVGAYSWSLLTSMGFKAMEGGGMAMANKGDPAALFDAMRAAGLPDEACDVTTLPVAMYMKGEVPLPAKVGIDMEVIPLEAGRLVADRNAGKFTGLPIYVVSLSSDPDIELYKVPLPGSSRPGRPRSLVPPMLGQQNRYVFGDLLGVSDREISRLEEEKVPH